MTVLSLIQATASRLSLPRPSAIVGEADESHHQFLELFIEECEALHKDHDWSDLITLRSFTCAATNAQAGEFQTDFSRMTEQSEIWNTSSRWPIKGPISASDWRFLTTTTISNYPQVWRRIAGVLNIFSPKAGETITYEYVSKNWCLTGGTTPADEITTDDDTTIFPDELLKLGLRWRWKNAKNLDYAEDLATYEREKAKAIIRDKGGTTSFSTMRETIADASGIYRTWPGMVVPP